MNGRYSSWIIWGVFAAVVAIWAASIWLTPYLAELMCGSPESSCGDLVSYAAVGDLFGAVNALFSGLALAAIALTLWIESRSRRESKKPLVLGQLESRSASELFPPDRVDGAMPLRLTVSMQNQTLDAALNVEVSAQFRSMAVSGKCSIDQPLLHQAVHEVQIELRLDGDARSQALTKLTSNGVLEVVVTTKYRSLEGVNWKTLVAYELSCDNERDVNILNGIRADNQAAWPKGATVALVAKLKSGSWDHALA